MIPVALHMARYRRRRQTVHPWGLVFTGRGPVTLNALFHITPEDVSSHAFLYSQDNGASWHTMADTVELTEDSPTLLVKTSKLRGGLSLPNGNFLKFKIDEGSSVAVSGSLYALLTPDPDVRPVLDSQNVFLRLFEECTGLTSAAGLQLSKSFWTGEFDQNGIPVVRHPDIPDSGMRAMFSGCSALEYPPEDIPAVRLGDSACGSMFERCVSLRRAPGINSIEMAGGACASMFSGCSAMTTPPPKLHPVNLSIGQYSRMFESCVALTTAPQMMFTTVSAMSCEGMFFNCPSLKTVGPLLPVALGANSHAYDYMFYGCSALETILTHQETFDSCDHWVGMLPSKGSFVCDLTSLANNQPNDDPTTSEKFPIKMGHSWAPAGWDQVDITTEPPDKEVTE